MVPVTYKLKAGGSLAAGMQQKLVTGTPSSHRASTGGDRTQVTISGSWREAHHGAGVGGEAA
jgi:hypothetical protein